MRNSFIGFIICTPRASGGDPVNIAVPTINDRYSPRKRG